MHDGTGREGAVSARSSRGRRAAPLVRGEARLADAEIERAVDDLRELSRRGPLEQALGAGGLVVERVFGNVEALRRRGAADLSYRKLARHPRLPWGAMWLWRAVRVYELTRRLPGTRDSKHLTLSHLRSVLGLPDDAQERLLRAAEKERWSVERLVARVAALRPRGPKRGRPPDAVIVKTLRAIMKRTADARVAELDGALAGLRRAEIESLRTSVRDLRAWCEGVESALYRQDASRSATA